MSAHSIAKNVLDTVKALPVADAGVSAPKGTDAAWRPAVPIGHTHFTWYGGVDGPNTVSNVSLIQKGWIATETKEAPKPAQPQPKKGSSKKSEKPAVEVPEPSMDLFSSLLFIVGRITSVKRHPNADKLYVETIDVGAAYGGERTIVSGLVPYMTEDELNGKMVIVAANLEPHDFRGVVSEGMILACQSEDGKSVKLIEPAAGAQPGDRVIPAGQDFSGKPVGEKLNMRKAPECLACFPHLKTNANGEATFMSVVLTTSTGPLTGGFPNAQIR